MTNDKGGHDWQGAELLGLLFRQFGEEGFLAIRDVAVVAFGVDEGIRCCSDEESRVLGIHVVVAAVGSEEEIDGLGFEKAEGALVVGGDAGVVFVATRM
jgi:hypothetical protein